MNEVTTSGVPYSWMLSELTPLFKGKASILECRNYIGIKLIIFITHLEATGTDNRPETNNYFGVW